MESFDDIRAGSSTNPISMSSSSATPLETASSFSSDYGGLDLDRALDAYQSKGNRRNANVKPSSSRDKLPTRRPVSNGKRRMLDETLVNEPDYSEPRKKARSFARSSSQTKLDGFVISSPSSTTRVGTDVRRSGTARDNSSALRRNTSSSTVRSAPSSQPKQAQGSSSRTRLDGSSAEVPIVVSDDSLPRATTASSSSVRPRPRSRTRSRPPAATNQSTTPSGTRGKVSQRTLGQTSSRGKKRNVDDDDDFEVLDVAPPPTTNGGRSRSRTSLTTSPQKAMGNPRILVPETVISPARRGVLVPETVISPPRPRDRRSASARGGRQESLVPDSVRSSRMRVEDSLEPEDRSVRNSSRARSAATPEERQERQRRANMRMLTPTPAAPLPSILEGLGKTPTPKKPSKDAPPPAHSSSSKRQLFPAVVALDEESYRPSPRSAFARPLKASKVAAYQANRPRRSVPEPGKYALPAIDAEQWPSRPGTTHTPKASRKEKRPESKSRTPAPAPPAEEPKAVDPPAAPSTPKRQRSRSVSSCLTPLPPTQLPARSSAARSPVAPIGSHVASSPPAPSGLTVVLEEPSPVPDKQPQEVNGSPAPAVSANDGDEQPQEVNGSPTPAEENGTGSETDIDNADSELGLDDYGDFAQFAESPSAPSLHNTPSKRSQRRLSLSPVARKVLQTPSSTRLAGASPRADGPEPASPRPVASPHPRTPSKARHSLTARILAEGLERDRQAMEAREAAQKAAEEREARYMEHAKLIEGSSDEDEDDNEISLSQVLGQIEARQTSSDGARRSSRLRPSASNADGECLPKMPTISNNKKHARLFKELDRDVKRGVTTAQVEAALSASPERKVAAVDLDNMAGVDENVVAEAQRIQSESRRKAAQEAVYSVFWEEGTRLAEPKPLLPFKAAFDDPAVEILEEVYDEATLVQLLWCLPVPKATEVGLNEWLFELAFCSPNEELAYVALERLLEFFAHSTAETVQGPDGLFWLLSAAWHQLGAKVEESERSLGRVARDRDTASAFVCRIASTAANNGWLGGHCAWVIICHLATLAGDSSTGTTLSGQISAAVADLFKLVLRDHDAMLAKELASHPLVPQVRAILTLGQRNAATRAAVRWAAIGLLLPDTASASSGTRPSVDLASSGTRPSVDLVIQALHRIEDELDAGDTDFARIANLVALWSTLLTDMDDGWASDPDASDLVGEIVRVRNKVREDADDPAIREVKGRLHQYHLIVNLHVQMAAERGQRARLSGKGLEMGVRGQARLSFGRESGSDA